MSLERVLSTLADKDRTGQTSEEAAAIKITDDISGLINRVMDIAIKSQEFKYARQRGDEEEQKRFLRQIIHIESENTYSYLNLTACDKAGILQRLLQKMFGFGVLQSLIENESITEIMVNGKNMIFMEKDGRIGRVLENGVQPTGFESEEEMLNIIQRIVSPVNRRVDESEPIVDARLPDGSRVNVVLSPVSLNGPVMTIRKFPKDPFSMEDLVRFEMLPAEVMGLLKCMVEARYNIIISGGTGTGKTTFLNALSQYIPENERIITIEDSAELKLNGIKNLVRLETRPPNIEGKGQIGMRDLVRTSLRMRPDRIIVGEVRGGEALDMLQAMNTGHDGSLSTGHANSAMDMLSRLETMVLMSGVDLPSVAVRTQIASAVDFIIHLGKLPGGMRKVMEISEILGIENGDIKLNRILVFEYERKSEGPADGTLKPTGNRIVNIGKFISAGINADKFKILGDMDGIWKDCTLLQ